MAPHALAQTAPVATVGAGPKDFLPPGWVVVRSCWGDLDGDGQDDLACVMNAGDLEKFQETLPVVGIPRIQPGTGLASFILDENPRILLILLSNGQGFRLGAYNQHILEPHQFPTGETLDKLEIAQGKVRLGLIYMNRRHGDVFARISYEFAGTDEGFRLVYATKTTIDRYMTDQEETRRLNFRAGKGKVEVASFSTGKALSEQLYELKVAAPYLQELRPNWPIDPGFTL